MVASERDGESDPHNEDRSVSGRRPEAVNQSKGPFLVAEKVKHTEAIHWELELVLPVVPVPLRRVMAKEKAVPTTGLAVSITVEMISDSTHSIQNYRGGGNLQGAWGT